MADTPPTEGPARRRAVGNPLDYFGKTWMRVFFAVFMLMLYAPIIVMAIFSFNDSKRNIVWRGFTTKYYARVMENDSLRDALLNSLTIAVVNTVVGTALGVLTAIFLWRFRFGFKPLLEGAYALPIVVPEICMGVAMLVFFSRIGWPGELVWPLSLANIMIAHITFTFPFVAVIVRGRLARLNQELEHAALDLGATRWQAMVDVLLPQIKPAIVAGALIAFMLSLDDFVITFFTAGPNSITLPVKIVSMVRFSVSPEVNAASTILMAITVVTTIVVLRIQTREKEPLIQ